MFYQVDFPPVTNNLLDNSSDIYLIVYGLIRSDRLIIRRPCVVLLCNNLKEQQLNLYHLTHMRYVPQKCLLKDL